jgi:hypothetical protein
VADEGLGTSVVIENYLGTDKHTDETTSINIVIPVPSAIQ